jgi:N-acetylmuramoyl-L-alanine amidase
MHFSPVALARMVAVTGAVALIAMQPRPDVASAAMTDNAAPSVNAVAEPAPVPTPQTVTIAEPPAAIEAVADTVPLQHGMDEETMCLAKIVHHESANQPREGQLAVAQVVMNRLASPRFPKSICAIALQPGQFFNVHAYNPRQDHRWDRAMEIALDARNGVSPPVVGEALFFHAAHAQPSFHRSRPRVTQIGHHVFYR